MSKPRLVVAAHILCYVNGTLLGRVAAFEWNSQTPRKEVRAVDTLETLELIPTATGVTFSMTVLRTTGDGGMQGIGAVAQAPDILSEKYVSFLLVDRRSDLPLFQADYCASSSESWRVVAKDMVRGDISFTGIGWANEASS